MEYRQRRDPKKFERKFHEYSFLVFEYEFPNNKKQKRYVPILENPTIKESQSSNLASYNLIGRNSTLYSYQSSESRRINLSFRIVYDHLEAIISQEGIPPQFYNTWSFEDYGYSNDEPTNILLGWLETIKTSTKNNSQNPSFGPPIIRVNHGAHYRNVPCIAKSFSIDYGGENADIFTKVIDNSNRQNIIHKVVNISLDLMEVRVGDFGDFKPKDTIKGDNNTGWEAVFDNGNMDPDNFIS